MNKETIMNEKDSNEITHETIKQKFPNRTLIGNDELNILGGKAICYEEFRAIIDDTFKDICDDLMIFDPLEVIDHKTIAFLFNFLIQKYDRNELFNLLLSMGMKTREIDFEDTNLDDTNLEDTN